MYRSLLASFLAVFRVSLLTMLVQYQRRPMDCLDLTLSRLGVDQLDLWLMHWPVATRDTGENPMVPRLENGHRDVDLDQTPEKTWKGMCEVLKSGKTKAIGVSNFSIPKLERLLATTDIVPAVNQGETRCLLFFGGMSED